MTIPVRLGVAALVVGLVAATFAAAPDKPLTPGKYRITLSSGRAVEGDVKELPDGSYEVKTKYGGVWTIKRNDVRRIDPLEEVSPGKANVSPGGGEPRKSGFRREISDEEIDEIIAGIEAVVDESVHGVARSDLMAPFPWDEDSVKDMFHKAGLTWKEGTPAADQDNLLSTDHFVLVFTGTRESAKKLAARLEAVWRWNVRFMEMLSIPARRPETKLEIFYFATQDDFERYGLNMGSPTPDGVLGYYNPAWNRSHFFDLDSARFLQGVKERLKQPGIPGRVRRYYTNVIERWVEYRNMEVIQHETGHHIHFNIGLFPRNGLERESSVPIWLVEGTTMMFEVPLSSAGASLGALNHFRLDTLRHTWGPHPLSPADWKLFIIDNGLWNGFHSYQLGWSMVYYLFREHREQYAKYLQTVFGRDEDTRMSNTEREKEFTDIFITGKFKTFDDFVNDFYRFLDTLRVRQSVLPPDLNNLVPP